MFVCVLQWNKDTLGLFVPMCSLIDLLQESDKSAPGKIIFLIIFCQQKRENASRARVWSGSSAVRPYFSMYTALYLRPQTCLVCWARKSFVFMLTCPFPLVVCSDSCKLSHLFIIIIIIIMIHDDCLLHLSQCSNWHSCIAWHKYILYFTQRTLNFFPIMPGHRGGTCLLQISCYSAW